MITLADYHSLVEDRPDKFSEDDVNYREADAKEKCGACLHFYERKLDRFGVCELMRPDDDGPVEPENTCDFFTKDGTTFPLKPRTR